MKYTTKAAEKSTVKITFKFDGEEWKAAIQNAYLKTRGRFAINGFRKGKAPRNVIENVYGKGVFYEDALNILFSENYPNVVEKMEKKYTVVGDPDVSIDKLEEDAVTLVAIVPVKPEVKISSYTGTLLRLKTAPNLCVHVQLLLRTEWCSAQTLPESKKQEKLLLSLL
ncbi:MAG: trigger factor family protein [Clostridia bacterium]|nr:trigger factor family protein [Clostridia bacterium]